MLADDRIRRGQIPIKTSLDSMVLGEDLAVAAAGAGTKCDKLYGLHLYRCITIARRLDMYIVVWLNLIYNLTVEIEPIKEILF